MDQLQVGICVIVDSCHALLLVFITNLLRVSGSARDGYGPGTSDFTNTILLQLADEFLYLLLTSRHLQGDCSAGHIDCMGSEEVTKLDDFSVVLRFAIDLHQRQFTGYSLFG